MTYKNKGNKYDVSVNAREEMEDMNEIKRTICWSFNCLATSLGPEPEISIQVLENRAQAESMKVM